MDDPTLLLFGLDEFRIVSVTEPVSHDADVRVVVETTDPVARCPSYGVVSRRLKDRPTRRIEDLPVSGQRVELWWRVARRWVCAEELCERRSFTVTLHPDPAADTCSAPQSLMAAAACS